MPDVVLAVGFVLFGFSIGSLVTKLVYDRFVMPAWKDAERERLVNARKRALHDNGRHLPKRPGVGGKPARVTKVKIRSRYTGPTKNM